MNNTIAFLDIETNGIEDWTHLSDLETIHCLVVNDRQTVKVATTDKEIKELLDLLGSYQTVVGHNVLGFDAPCLEKKYGFKHPNLLDTAVLSRCVYPDISAYDYKVNEFPTSLIGRHSLKAWGVRLGNLKDDHGETEDWTSCTPEMIEYCKQDVEVTISVYDHLMKKEPSEMMVKLEHQFASLMLDQERNGFPFDVTKAEKLCGILCSERAALKQELQKIFPAEQIKMKSQWWVTPDGIKWNTKKQAVAKGYKAGEVEKGDFKTKEVPFNPNSRDQICERFMAQGWKPEAYEGKRPAINEAVLKKIGTDEALKLSEYLMITKRLGQLSEGKQAWLGMLKNGRIHGRVNTNGAVSGRCTHNRPNMAQVPASRAPYGKECRELFTAPKGKVLVGADASGLELRCLAHYLWRWDNGAYAKKILDGDIHTENQQAAGLETRDQAKTFIYAFLYGAGDGKIGEIVRGTSRDGRRLKDSFFERMPAIKRLVLAVEKSVNNHNLLKGLDGRWLPCRSAHSALNLLLQSAGAVVMKQALVCFAEDAQQPYELHGNIHDEVQFSCDAEHADELGSLFCSSLGKAGEMLGFRCQLDGEYKIGNNWSDTH